MRLCWEGSLQKELNNASGEGFLSSFRGLVLGLEEGSEIELFLAENCEFCDNWAEN